MSNPMRSLAEIKSAIVEGVSKPSTPDFSKTTEIMVAGFDPIKVMLCAYVQIAVGGKHVALTRAEAHDLAAALVFYAQKGMN